MPIKNWSVIAASNTSAPPFGAPESSTKFKDWNDIGRQIMADTRTLCASATVASAATTDLGASDETWLTVSGTTTITAFGTVSAGIYKFVTFSGALTLTHNATSLILLGGANRTTVAGDCGLYVSLGSGNWKEYFYSPYGTPASYQPLDAQLTTLAGITSQQATDLASLSTLIGTLLNDTSQTTALTTLGAPLNAVSTKSANYTVVAADMGKFFHVSGTTTISLDAVATLGSNFSFSIRNAGVNTVTIDPNLAETIDGVATVALMPGETCFVICDGTSWITVARASNPYAVNQSLAASGYQKFPGGLVLQWGVTSSVANGAGRTATFPIAFPTAAFAGFVMGTVGGGTAEANHVVTALSTTTLTFTNNSSTTQPFYFFAIGN